MFSEESDSQADLVSWSKNIPEDILKLEKGREVSADSITVWIDPLDATQEYTGGSASAIFCVIISEKNNNDIAIPSLLFLLYLGSSSRKHLRDLYSSF